LLRRTVNCTDRDAHHCSFPLTDCRSNCCAYFCTDLLSLVKTDRCNYLADSLALSQPHQTPNRVSGAANASKAYS
jgi:hypothetical protein